MHTTPGPEHDDLRAAARRTATEAVHDARIEVHEIQEPTEARAVAALLDEVWRRDRTTSPALQPETLTALAHSGCQVSVAHRSGVRGAPDHDAGTQPGDAPVAATVAWLGRDPATGGTTLYSHVTAVRGDDQEHRIAHAMRWHQRAWALEHQLTTVRWALDPLERRAAVLDLALLGATATAYHVDHFGPMAITPDHALPTDRVTVVWDLDAPRVHSAAAGRAASPDVAALRAAGAEVAVAVGDDGGPVRHATDAPRRLVQVPPDIAALRVHDPEPALAWTHAIRETVGAGLEAGGRVSGITRDGWYVLADRAGVQELSSPR